MTEAVEAKMDIGRTEALPDTAAGAEDAGGWPLMTADDGNGMRTRLVALDDLFELGLRASQSLSVPEPVHPDTPPPT